MDLSCLRVVHLLIWLGFNAWSISTGMLNSSQEVYITPSWVTRPQLVTGDMVMLDWCPPGV